MTDKLRGLVLYDEAATHTPTVLEHLQAFARFSQHTFYYARAVRGVPLALDLANFDFVVIHYSVRLTLPDFISPSYAAALSAYEGLKILFIQDEYEMTEQARQWMERLGVRLVFTCVPERFVAQVYPPARFLETEFVTTLTGFVPARLEGGFPVAPLSERRVLLAYRGRALPYWYGIMGQDKQNIGVRMRALCEARSKPCDIEWDESKRIYGDDWYTFIASARATLGTESGANVFDERGDLKRAIRAELEKDPNVGFETIFDRYLAPFEGRVQMNQVSPRIFEAVALRTALVLFEGEYSGVVRPWEHYLPLKKDFSNAEEILARLDDLSLLEEMTERAYRELIQSGRYSYRRAMEGYDALFSARVRARASRTPLAVIMANGKHHERPIFEASAFESVLGDFVTSEPMLREELQQSMHQRLSPTQELALAAWRALPGRVRKAFSPVLPEPILSRLSRRPP
ncbi:MAG: hypothetical protein IT384_06765 [Deltaproteobacteria bacterium]|nr:hypothetical protein [Deltaproteobacteria bacterium]